MAINVDMSQLSERIERQYSKFVNAARKESLSPELSIPIDAYPLLWPVLASAILEDTAKKHLKWFKGDLDLGKAGYAVLGRSVANFTDIMGLLHPWYKDNFESGSTIPYTKKDLVEVTRAIEEAEVAVLGFTAAPHADAIRNGHYRDFASGDVIRSVLDINGAVVDTQDRRESVVMHFSDEPVKVPDGYGYTVSTGRQGPGGRVHRFTMDVTGESTHYTIGVDNTLHPTELHPGCGYRLEAYPAVLTREEFMRGNYMNAWTIPPNHPDKHRLTAAMGNLTALRRQLRSMSALVSGYGLKEDGKMLYYPNAEDFLSSLLEKVFVGPIEELAQQLLGSLLDSDEWAYWQVVRLSSVRTAYVLRGDYLRIRALELIEEGYEDMFL